MAKEQAFLPDGTAAAGIAFDRSELDARSDYLMGTVHVWVWRRSARGIEVLVQLRSQQKKTHPGMLDISVAGHIDADESAIQAALREFDEELGGLADPNALQFVFRLRKTNVANVIATVFLCEVDTTFNPQFRDGEVEDVSWVDLIELKKITDHPADHNFADHGRGYFVLLNENLGRV